MNNFVILGSNREALVWKVVDGRMKTDIGSPYSITRSRNLRGAKINSHEHKSAITRIIRPPQDIFQAAAKGTVLDVEWFISNGSDVHAKSEGMSLLHFATEHNPNVEVVRYLVSKGADVHAKADWGSTPLHHAALNNSNVEIVKFIVSKGGDVNAKNYDGWTPLLDAAKQNSNVEVLKYLIAQGADVNARLNDGRTPIDLANTEEKRAILRAAGGRSGR